LLRYVSGSFAASYFPVAPYQGLGPSSLPFVFAMTILPGDAFD